MFSDNKEWNMTFNKYTKIYRKLTKKIGNESRPSSGSWYPWAVPAGARTTVPQVWCRWVSCPSHATVAATPTPTLRCSPAAAPTYNISVSSSTIPVVIHSMKVPHHLYLFIFSPQRTAVASISSGHWLPSMLQRLTDDSLQWLIKANNVWEMVIPVALLAWNSTRKAHNALSKNICIEYNSADFRMLL